MTQLNGGWTWGVWSASNTSISTTGRIIEVGSIYFMDDIAIIVKCNCTNEFGWYMFIMDMTYMYKWNFEMD